MKPYSFIFKYDIDKTHLYVVKLGLWRLGQKLKWLVYVVYEHVLGKRFRNTV
jgi:hypothetical protein